MKKSILITILFISIPCLAIVGEVKCIIKAFNCNWEPVGKAEVIYTAASLTGFGAIVGWFEIKDK